MKKYKLIQNWPQKSIESLENDTWPAPSSDEGSYLIQTCHSLRKKPLNTFEIEDLRILIGQDISLPILMPLAIEVLSESILAEGDLYPGDLLKSVLTSDAQFWVENKTLYRSMVSLLEANDQIIKLADLSWSIKKDMKEALLMFKQILGNEA